MAVNINHPFDFQSIPRINTDRILAGNREDWFRILADRFVSKIGS